MTVEERLASIEAKQDIIIDRMPDKGSIMERLKIHSYLITLLFGGILSVVFFIIKRSII